MSDLIHLGPESLIPLWVEILEETAFDGPWGPLENHEHLLGFPPLAFVRWCAIPTADEAELLRIAVTPGSRRQGLARRLLQASEPFLLEQGIHNLYLEVRTSNVPARALYKSMGWTLQRMRKGYYRDGEDAVIYWKQLQA